MSFKEFAAKELSFTHTSAEHSAKTAKEVAFERASAKHRIDIKPQDGPAADQSAAPAKTVPAPHV